MANKVSRKPAKAAAADLPLPTLVPVFTLTEEFRGGLSDVDKMLPGTNRWDWTNRQMAYLLYLRATGQSDKNIAAALGVKFWRVRSFWAAAKRDHKYFLLSHFVGKYPVGSGYTWVCRYCRVSFPYAKTAVDHAWEHCFNRGYRLTDPRFIEENPGLALDGL